MAETSHDSTSTVVLVGGLALLAYMLLRGAGDVFGDAGGGGAGGPSYEDERIATRYAPGTSEADYYMQDSSRVAYGGRDGQAYDNSIMFTQAGRGGRVEQRVDPSVVGLYGTSLGLALPEPARADPKVNNKGSYRADSRGNLAFFSTPTAAAPGSIVANGFILDSSVTVGPTQAGSVDSKGKTSSKAPAPPPKFKSDKEAKAWGNNPYKYNAKDYKKYGKNPKPGAN